MPGSSTRPAPSSHRGCSACSSAEVRSPPVVEQQALKDGIADESEGGGSTQDGGVGFPLTQRWEQHMRHPLHLSQQEVSDLTQLCLGVIEEHEEEQAALACAALCRKRGLDDVRASEEGLEEEGGDPHLHRTGERSARCRIDEVNNFANYEALRPAYFQELRVASAEAANDLQATGDPALSEASGEGAVMPVTTTREVSVSCLLSVHREDVAFLSGTPHDVLSRSRTILSLALLAGNKYIALRQGARFKSHLQLIRSRREEELRGFLLFLSAQFLSARAELPLETLKAHLRLVGRSDLLRDFDELDSLEAFLSYCESLKYIIIVRRSLGADVDIGASIFILPTGRLLHELRSDAFRDECREHFGVEPPDTPLQPPGAEPPDPRPSQSGASTQAVG
ncbi:hypothetical protein ACSSS7_007204 [Eimeria intestinalis]